MYVKASNQTVEIFPYSIGNLRRDNPNTSFPKNPSSEILADWGVYPVVLGPIPTPAAGYVVEQESEPTYADGVWTLNFTTRACTQEESDVLANSIRMDRDSLLAQSDWTQVGDSPLSTADKEAWATYRQALRDITAQTGFPYQITWPTAP